MTERRGRFGTWAKAPPTGESDAVPAATVVLLRDSTGSERVGATSGGIEALMLLRSSTLAFAGGMWVFPGGRVDAGDWEGAGGDELVASTRAAVREAEEEAGLVVDPASLVPFSHWTPPPQAPKRFATWFFLAEGPSGVVTVDGAEIHEHAWTTPSEALARRDRREIELAPPTWVTLHRLASHRSAAEAIAGARASRPEIFSTRFSLADDVAVALWSGDAGYESSDASVAGPRHRLWMLPEGWRYERSEDAALPAEGTGGPVTDGMGGSVAVSPPRP